ncbi:MAG TPA: tripartite tricarboxylate transporter substrate-binding protein, partial [Burkholderiales bacterium]
GFSATAWYGMLAPVGTPNGVILQLNKALASALETPQVKARLLAEGAAPESSSPAELAAIIRNDIGRWAKALKIAGITN